MGLTSLGLWPALKYTATSSTSPRSTWGPGQAKWLTVGAGTRGALEREDGHSAGTHSGAHERTRIRTAPQNDGPSSPSSSRPTPLCAAISKNADGEGRVSLFRSSRRTGRMPVPRPAAMSLVLRAMEFGPM